MDVTLRFITTLADAEPLVPELQRRAAEAMEEFRDDPLPAGTVERALTKHFESAACCLLVAESEEAAADLGLCLVLPFEDPLTAEILPLMSVLYVDTKVRHRGLARSMVQATRQRLEARGQNKLAARAGHNDDALISMGERWGFVRTWDLMIRE